MGTEIFISYCRKDITIAKRIKEEIEQSTFAKCWMDLDGIESGSQFEDIIISAIDNSRIVVFLLSENSMKSKWTKDEVRYAYETQKKIIPINIDRCAPSGWFLFKFSGFDVIDFNDSAQKYKFFENIREWTEKKETNEFSVVERNGQIIKRLRLWGGTVQTMLFGSILVTMCSMFFFGLLTMDDGIVAMRYNILLCLCLCGTLYSTYLLFAKQKKYALYIIGILDVFEMILLCAVAKRITGYSLLYGYNYRSFPYLQMNGLGYEMARMGGFLVNSLMELFTILHMSFLIGYLFLRIKGYRLWDVLQ